MQPFTTYTGHLGCPSEEVQWKRTSKLKIKAPQNHLLHLQNLRLCECVVCDVGEVSNLRSVHLLVFTGHQHGCHANKLQRTRTVWIELQEQVTYSTESEQ